MNQAMFARKIGTTIVLLLLAISLFFLGTGAYQGTEWAVERAIYYSGAAVVSAIAIGPWAIKE